MLKINGISAGYQTGEILHDISFSASKGEFIALLGPNGAGKSTLLKTIIGFLPPSSGSVSVDGKNVNRWSRRELASRMAFIPQDTFHQFEFTVEELVLMGRYPYLNFLQRYSKDDINVVTEVMTKFQLNELRDRYINELSGGERQRVFLARAIAQDTDILLLDETFSHLDINHQIEMMQLLHIIHKETGKLIILVSHNINLTANFCDRIILMKSGSIVADGTPVDIITEARIKEAYDMDFLINTNPLSNRPNLIYPGI
ncbi:MAG: ABC transporter ATP-binding protein [Candidatus Cloacimonetes bacterium]|nr:ABC transporter ATP-binding protein [Candidatus Cloacimonadota bacterium]